MGHTKRKGSRPTAQVRTRTTRSKGRPLADPAENTQLLTEQLRALGLYAAPTLGDGNCLFRALSDQLYGTPSYHLNLRQAICDWIETHKQRYEPFVEDERGFDVHLQCMRQQGTYGGHMELSAFAHMTRRNVKVIQPGLVYVIEWDAGGELDTTLSPTPSQSLALPPAADDTNLNEREKRRLKRDQKRADKEKSTFPPPPDTSDDSPPGPVYVAYHDWEHFSSIRNLRGPHSGLPNVQESLVPDDDPVPGPSPVKKPTSKTKPKSSSKCSNAKSRTSVPLETPPLPIEEPSVLPSTPSCIPLPVSRSPSPESLSQPPPAPYPFPSAIPSAPSALSHAYRSPKRTFDESSASSEGSQGAAKRAKSSSRRPYADSIQATGAQTPLAEYGDAADRNDIEVDEDDTPSLSASNPGSPSSSSLSSVPSPEPSPPPQPQPEERRLTRRQRKQLGFPKPRAALVASTRASAGKIVIPGGRFKGMGNGAGKSGEGDEEWQKNGTGRVDVRGFRELKI